MRAIASSNVVIDGALQEATIIFSTTSGKIVHIVDSVVKQDDPVLSRFNVESYRDVSPMYVMPGLVDLHVHLNEPGRTEWEGFATGTQLLIAGGVTTIVDMPLNAIPPTTTIKNFEIKLQLATGQVWCDVGFWGGLVPDNLDDLVPLIEAGVRGFKGFLIDSGVDEFPLINPVYIEKLMSIVEPYKTVLMFHLEMQPRTSLGPQVGTKFELSADDELVGDYHQPSPLQTDDEIEDLNLGMSQSFISRAPPLVTQLLKHNHHHKDDHLNCNLPHNHAGSIDHNVLSDEQLMALSKSPLLLALEPKFGHLAELVNHHHHHHHEEDHIKSPLLELATTDSTLDKIDPTLYLSFLASRPDVFETTAIAEIIACSTKNPRVPLHIVHLGTHELVPLLRAAFEQNLPISVETCFHYLSLTAESIINGSTQFKCCPPIRTEQNKNLLWKLLEEGIIKTVVSDHSPCIPELKSFESGDFFEAWGGISSVGLGLSILFTEIQDKPNLSINDIVRWCCENTAKQIGLADSKGFIKVGHDADFAIFDPNTKFTITNDQVFFKNKFTAYNGFNLKGRVVETILRGNSIYALGKGCSDLPMGQLLLNKRIL